MKDCPNCNGSGKALSGRICPACTGSKTVTAKRYKVIVDIANRVKFNNHKKNTWSIC